MKLETETAFRVVVSLAEAKVLRQVGNYSWRIAEQLHADLVSDGDEEVFTTAEINAVIGEFFAMFEAV